LLLARKKSSFCPAIFWGFITDILTDNCRQGCSLSWMRTLFYFQYFPVYRLILSAFDWVPQYIRWKGHFISLCFLRESPIAWVLFHVLKVSVT
jgi:hypothetical protein